MSQDEKLFHDISLLATKFTSGVLSKANNDMSLYEFVTKKYSFGNRQIAIPKLEQTIEDLQSIRGITIDVDAIKENKIEKISQKVEQYHSHDCEKRMKHLLKFVSEKESYYEIGFRSVDSLKLAQKHFKNISGCDIGPLSVAVAQQLKFNVFRHDLMCDNKIPTDIIPDVIVAYHDLEHTYCPEKCIQKIIDASKLGTIIQLEIPIQPGKPLVRYGHLFSFEKNDLKILLEETGRVKFLESELTGKIERHICQID